MSTQIDLEDWVIGDAKTFRVVCTGVNGDPVDIAGDLLLFTVKTDLAKTDAQATFQVKETVPDDDNSENGIGYLEIDHIDSVKPAVGSYYYSLRWVRMTPNPEKPYTPIYGKVKFVMAATREIT
jgi:hypothetical protein